MGQTADDMRERTEDRLAERQPAEIRAEIEQKRTEISQTVDALQAKLSPENIKEQATDTVKDLAETAKDAAREAVHEMFYQVKQGVRDATLGRVEDMAKYANKKGNTILDTIRQNPVPAAMAAVGLGWLIFKGPDNDNEYDYSRSRRAGGYTGEYAYREGMTRRYDYQSQRDADGGIIDEAREKASELTDTAKDVVGSAKDAIGSAASTVKDTVSNVAGEAKSTVSDVADQTRYQASYRTRQARGGFEQMLEEKPLAVGAIAVALGTAIGLAAPGTDTERKLMGETRDSFVEKAQTVAQDKLNQIAGVAQEALKTAQDEARVAVDSVKETVRQEAESQGLTQKKDQDMGQGNQMGQGQGMARASQTGQGSGSSGQWPR